MEIIPTCKKPQTLPAVLSPEEVLQLLDCVQSIKQRAILTAWTIELESRRPVANIGYRSFSCAHFGWFQAVWRVIVNIPMIMADCGPTHISILKQ